MAAFLKFLSASFRLGTLEFVIPSSLRKSSTPSLRAKRGSPCLDRRRPSAFAMTNLSSGVINNALWRVYFFRFLTWPNTAVGSPLPVIGVRHQFRCGALRRTPWASLRLGEFGL